MIRFVDLTPFYWTENTGKPCCAFLNTVTDLFVENSSGEHVFDDEEDVRNLGDRFWNLVPENFFHKPSVEPTPFDFVNRVRVRRSG